MCECFGETVDVVRARSLLLKSSVRVHKKHITTQADIWDNTSGSELTLHIRENSPCSHQYSNNKTLTWLHNCIHLQNWVSNNNLTTYQQVRTFPPALPVFWELNLLILSVQMDTHSSWAVLYKECLSRVVWLSLSLPFHLICLWVGVWKNLAFLLPISIS